jgi:hypothetical protein
MRPFGPQRGGNEVYQVGEMILLTKENPGCRVVELPLLQLHPLFIAQSYGVISLLVFWK